MYEGVNKSMENKIKYYSQKCFEYILTHTVWYLITTVIGFVSLNIPKAVSNYLEAKNGLLIFSNILSAVSILVLIICIVVFTWALLFNKTKSSHIVTDEKKEEKPGT